MSEGEMSARLQAHYRLTRPRRSRETEWATEAKVDRSKKKKKQPEGAPAMPGP